MIYAQDAKPARKGITSKGLGQIMVVVAVMSVVTPIAIVWILVNTGTYQTGPPMGAENPVGLMTRRSPSGDWEINITSGGGQALGNVTFLVIDNRTGAALLSTGLSAFNSTFGSYLDADRNGKINAGDRIVLKSSSTIKPGLKVQVLKGESVIATIRELPG
jgi:hypothetical protein